MIPLHNYCVKSVCEGSDCTKAKCDTCFRHLNAPVKTIGEFTVTHFPGVSVTINCMAVILTLTLSIEISQLTFACFIEKNMMGKECIVVVCCNRDIDKQLELKFHRLPKEDTRFIICQVMQIVLIWYRSKTNKNDQVNI